MKEYKVLARHRESGKWIKPFHHIDNIGKTKDEALHLLEVAKKRDADNAYLNIDKKPMFDAFKIMEREVSEWKDDEVIS